MTDFVKASSAHTVAQLAALPARDQLKKRLIAANAAGVRYDRVRSAGGKLFFWRTKAGAQLPALAVRQADGTERILYDPGSGEVSGPALNSYSISPLGRTVAFHTATGGGEIGSVRFLDVATGKMLDDRLEPVWGEFRVTWLDETTVAYTRLAPLGDGKDPLKGMNVFIHRLGGSDSQAILGVDALAAPLFATTEFPQVFSDPQSEWVVGTGGNVRREGRVMVARRSDLLSAKPAWHEIAGYDDSIEDIVLIGTRLYLLSTKRQPNGEVLQIDLSRGEGLSDARIAVPASDVVVRSLFSAGGDPYILGQTDGFSRMLRLDGNTGKIREISLPFRGTITNPQSGSADAPLTFALQNYLTAPRFFEVSGEKVRPLGLDSASFTPRRPLAELRELATSADGTKVPLVILVAQDSVAGPGPALLSGYGSYGVLHTEPRYNPNAVAFVEQGGVAAYCGTRGGGERGQSWYRAGQKTNKRNAHADLAACAERLIALKLTTAEKLTVFGRSAGGLLAPPTAMTRPELFAGLIAQVAILNPTRLGIAENGSNQFPEMGDPNTKEGFDSLLLSDSYQALGRARDLPPTLLLVGLNDHRVAPWMSAKVAARALDLFGDKTLVLLRTDPDAGHGIGSTHDQVIEQWADMYSFVLNRAGAKGFAP